MGISFHEFSFLKYSKKKKEFTSLGIFGRQQNFLNNTLYKNFIFKKLTNLEYADKILIDQLNLKKLFTYDVSDQEKPSKIENFNHIIENPELFDAFYDGGSLQHTFNIPNVLQNICNHVKVGGTIIHVTSSNNLCGFGFYQFSPEFFLNYYSEKNGFFNTEIFVANYDNHKEWFKLKEGLISNININTSARLICLVRTEKAHDSEVKDLFQSQTFDNNRGTDIKTYKNKFFLKLYFKLLSILDLLHNNLSLRLNKNLIKKDIDKLL